MGFIKFMIFFNVQMHDPNGISNWSVTHVDWSEGKWHPKSYGEKDVSEQLLKNLTVCSTITILMELEFVIPFYVLLVWFPNGWNSVFQFCLNPSKIFY